MSINVLEKFYPVLRLPDAEIFRRDPKNAFRFYITVLDAISDAASNVCSKMESSYNDNESNCRVNVLGHERPKAKLEISLGSFGLFACLDSLQAYAAERDIEISLATLTKADDYYRILDLVKEQGLRPMKIFSPGVVDGLSLKDCADPHLQYVPGVYSKHDFDLLTNFSNHNLDSLTMIKVFPVTATKAEDLKTFLKGPFPELKNLVAVSKDLRDRYLGSFTKISSPSDYMILRAYFTDSSAGKLDAQKQTLVLVEPHELRANDICGFELMRYLRSEFPALKIIAAGIRDFSTLFELGATINSDDFMENLEHESVFAKPLYDAVATALFKMPISRITSDFELVDYDLALEEMRGEMALEHANIFRLLESSGL